MACEWEETIVNLFYLSLKSSDGGVEIEYIVVKDYSQEYEMNPIDTYVTLKNILSVVEQR